MDSRKQINGHGQADDVDYEHPFGGAKADFTARKFDWLKGVSFDPELGPFDFEVAFWIMQHVNEAKGVAWPSDNLIAGLVGGSARHVQRARQRLEERGWLEWENTFGESNTYKPKYDRVSGMLDAITVFREGRQQRQRRRGEPRTRESEVAGIPRTRESDPPRTRESD
jgi:hypothetical protein